MHVVFIGLAGAGKSTWGRELARLLVCPFADLDLLVEHALQQSISELFSAGQAEKFRRMEAQILGTMLDDDDPGVMATGGGAPMFNGNDALWHRAHVIWLNPPLKAVIQRLEKEWHQRPLLSKRGADHWQTELTQQLESRKSRYMELADEVWPEASAEALHARCEAFCAHWASRFRKVQDK